MSAQLLVLSNAGLVRARREGRSIIYAVDFEPMSALLLFLTEDCCGGRPEICAPLASVANAAARPKNAPAGKMTPYNVLFLCTGNSARSIMAEAILNRVGAKGKIPCLFRRLRSQGRGQSGHALTLLDKLGYDTSGLRSKSWNEFATPGAPALDFVFTVCDNAANEVCPVWPGQPMTAHWGIPDPAAQRQGTSRNRARLPQMPMPHAERRIELFAALPFKSLDRMSLKKRLDGIGAAEHAA